MSIIKLLFPMLETFESVFGYEDEIVINNFNLAKELDEKGMPPMSGQEIKEYVKNKRNEG
jgi:hypothetical protein